MDSVLITWAIPLAAQYLAADANSDLIPSLLTGGGFVFLAAIMGGLFLLNKNQADAAAALAQGSTALVGGIRTELEACQTGLGELRIATEKMADAFDSIMARAQPVNGHEVTVTVTKVEAAAVRAAIQEARKHLH